jgi:hypothetical protein
VDLRLTQLGCVGRRLDFRFSMSFAFTVSLPVLFPSPDTPAHTELCGGWSRTEFDRECLWYVSKVHAVIPILRVGFSFLTLILSSSKLFKHNVIFARILSDNGTHYSTLVLHRLSSQLLL